MKKSTKKRKLKTRLIIVIIIFLSMFTFSLFINNKKDNKNINLQQIQSIPYKSNTIHSGNSSLYLSDIDPIEKSFSYRDITKDQDANGNPITLKVENNLFSFEKGVFAHAKATLVYDLTKYSDYKYFIAFIGLNNTAASSSNGVIYHFYTSNDKQDWQEIGNGTLKKPGENATYVEIPLNNAKYIKIYIDDNGSNGNDHSVLADAKFVKEIDNNFAIKSVAEYDNEIKNQFPNQTEITSDLEFALLKKELVERVGQYTINSFYNTSTENQETINWLMSNQDILRYYILGGTPDGGSYYNSLTQLSRLYHEYASDFDNTELLNNKWEPNLTYGDLYKKMAITLSLTHAQAVELWMQSNREENQSDALRRYAIFKYLHNEGRLKASDTLDFTPLFESLKIEEMRFVLNNSIDDEEILWLNSYVKTKITEQPDKAWITPHPHIAYVWPNYENDVYYDDNNYEYFNELFSVLETSISENKIGMYDLEYTIPGGKNITSYTIKISRGTLDNKLNKVWMNFRNKFDTGAVCGGISKSGSNIRATHGIPATVIGQPGHAALLYYSKDAQGKGYWGIDNDVSGWTQSEKGERLMLGWGNANYTKGSYQVVYMTLAQEALNNYDSLIASEEKLMLARTYSNDKAKQEELIREAIRIQNINIDAWYDLITLYNNDSNKSEEDFYNLAEELSENLKYFPLPMYQLTNLIKPNLTSVEYSYKFTLLQGRILKEASETPDNTTETYYVYQPSVTRTEANYLLGKVDTSIASFSFDGNDAGKIVLSSRFDGNGVRWDYSLDGKNTWHEVSFTAEETHNLLLSNEEINSITAENDIYVHIVGVNYDENNLYKIDITEGTLLNTLFANDLENKVIGADSNTEWRYNESFPWTSYNENHPDLTGDITIEVRQAANGTKLASNSEVYTFTSDNQPSTRKYIYSSHLSINSVSTEATGHEGGATNAIDANYNTRYHSDWNGNDTERYIVIKLDKAFNLSAVEFVPAGGGNGKIYDGTIYGSMDGENWEELVSVKNITYSNSADTVLEAIDNIKCFEISEPREVQYVKIVADRTNGNWFTARALNLYQDTTKNPIPEAEIVYSTTVKTNGQVVAKLVNPSKNITIINNEGKDTYTFTENGEFTFEFIDEYDVKGSAISRVDWIDNVSPTASIKYESFANTIIATLVNESESITVTNNNGNREYIFTENGEFTFEFVDLAGNKGTVKATAYSIGKQGNRSSINKESLNNTSTSIKYNSNNTNENSEFVDTKEESLKNEIQKEENVKNTTIDSQNVSTTLNKQQVVSSQEKTKSSNSKLIIISLIITGIIIIGIIFSKSNILHKKKKYNK